MPDEAYEGYTVHDSWEYRNPGSPKKQILTRLYKALRPQSSEINSQDEFVQAHLNEEAYKKYLKEREGFVHYYTDKKALDKFGFVPV